MKKIYIGCPASTATGGPELLHQLCYKLKKNGYDSSMYYYGKYTDNPVHERYKMYNNEYTTTLVDDDNSIVIVPETNIDILNKFNKVTRVIWWLSVDNYHKVINYFSNKIQSFIRKKNYDYHNKQFKHFVQSKYAYDFLIKNSINDRDIFYLSDYLNRAFIENTLKETKVKRDRVLYNPKKGYEFTKKLIDKFPEFEWVALENLTLIEISKLMQESKVYIDFGNHPGKDRIPREAAISGCCVITGRRGSAKFSEDVNISSEFKFEDTDESIVAIGEKIKNILINYEFEIRKFEKYRTIILNEENKFEEDMKNIFRLLTK